MLFSLGCLSTGLHGIQLERLGGTKNYLVKDWWRRWWLRRGVFDLRGDEVTDISILDTYALIYGQQPPK